MNQKYINIFFLIIILYYLFKSFFIEKLSQTTDEKYFKNLIHEMYNIDISSIRNLSKIANDLTNGTLTVPGGLHIIGDLTIDGNIGIKTNPHKSIGININTTNLGRGLHIQKGKGDELAHGYTADIYSEGIVTGRENRLNVNAINSKY